VDLDRVSCMMPLLPTSIEASSKDDGSSGIIHDSRNGRVLYSVDSAAPLKVHAVCVNVKVDGMWR
jgi:hypothetical protein